MTLFKFQPRAIRVSNRAVSKSNFLGLVSRRIQDISPLRIP